MVSEDDSHFPEVKCKSKDIKPLRKKAKMDESDVLEISTDAAELFEEDKIEAIDQSETNFSTDKETLQTTEEVRSKEDILPETSKEADIGNPSEINSSALVENTVPYNDQDELTEKNISPVDFAEKENKTSDNVENNPIQLEEKENSSKDDSGIEDNSNNSDQTGAKGNELAASDSKDDPTSSKDSVDDPEEIREIQRVLSKESNSDILIILDSFQEDKTSDNEDNSNNLKSEERALGVGSRKDDQIQDNSNQCKTKEIETFFKNDDVEQGKKNPVLDRNSLSRNASKISSITNTESKLQQRLIIKKKQKNMNKKKNRRLKRLKILTEQLTKNLRVAQKNPSNLLSYQRREQFQNNAGNSTLPERFLSGSSNLVFPSTSGFGTQSSNSTQSSLDSGRKRKRNFLDSSSEFTPVFCKRRICEVNSIPYNDLDQTRNGIDEGYRSEAHYWEDPVIEPMEFESNEYQLGPLQFSTEPSTSYAGCQNFENRSFEMEITFENNRAPVNNLVSAKNRLGIQSNFAQQEYFSENQGNLSENQEDFSMNQDNFLGKKQRKRSSLKSRLGGISENRDKISENQGNFSQNPGVFSANQENLSVRETRKRGNLKSRLGNVSSFESCGSFMMKPIPENNTHLIVNPVNKTNEFLLRRDKVLKKERLSEEMFCQESPLIRVIVPQNFKRIGVTKKQMLLVSEAILQEIDKIDGERVPKFNDSYIRNGGIITECADEWSRDWLMDVVPRLVPWGGAKLSVVDLSHLEKYYKAILKVPGLLESKKIVLRRLEKQNPTLNTKNWKVYSIEKQVPLKGCNFFLGIPKSSVDALKELKFQPFLGIGRTCINVSHLEDRG